MKKNKPTPQEVRNIIAEKVTGKWEAAHDEKGHHYRNIETGVIKDSVTTILAVLDKPHLKTWRVKKGIEWLEREHRFLRLKDPVERENLLRGAYQAPEDVKNEAGGVGSTAHEVIEAYTNEAIATGKWPEDIKTFFPSHGAVDPRAIASARSFERITKEHPIIPIAAEILVGDPKHSCGTLDLLCMYDGEICLLDHKTSNRVDPTSYPLQIAAYSKFFEKMTGLKVKQHKIFLYSKDMDKYTIYDVPYISQAFTAFKGLCRTYDWIQKPEEERIIKVVKKLII